MKTSSVIKLFALLGILVIAIPEPVLAQKPEEQFQKGLIKEEGEGALLEAIDIYNEVAEDESAKRSLQAKSLLHVGLCYEKLGKQEAERTYRKIINQFPDQTETVKVAREKLSLLARVETAGREESRELNIRKVWEGPDDLGGEPSPDGRYLSYLDWDTGDLAIFEIASGEKRRLTNKGSWEESVEFAESSRWSPDSKQIVYTWFNEKYFYDLYIIGIDGSGPRMLFDNSEEVNWIQLCDWSPDGKQILACFEYNDEPTRLVLVTVADGSVRVLKTIDGYSAQKCFSTDGEYIVYDHPQEENTKARDIFMLSIDGSSQTTPVKHPADDFLMGLAPDGKSLLFSSDRNGSLSFYVIQVTNGKSMGNPILVKSDMGSVEALGFTPDGSFYYSNSPEWNDIYMAELDPATGEILSPSKLETRFEGYNKQPDFSPDGKQLAYITVQNPSLAPEVWGGDVLVIRTIETGQEREIIPGLYSIGFPTWYPDGQSIMVVVRNANNQYGYCQIDAQTGKVETVISIEELIRVFGRHGWSPDGRSFIYGRWDLDNGLHEIIVRELQSGTEKVLYQSKDKLHFDISPDGQWLAIYSWSFEGLGSSLMVLPVEGGEVKELSKFGGDENINLDCTTWTLDAKYIRFLMRDVKDEDPMWELCRIPAEGGEIEKLGLTGGKEMSNLSVHPGGRHISYSSVSELLSPTVWVMENFLPTEKMTVGVGQQ